jgi:predicted Zn-dependent protease
VRHDRTLRVLLLMRAESFYSKCSSARHQNNAGVGKSKAADHTRAMPLNEPDNFALKEARAWLALGDAVSALSELERLPSSNRNEPVVLRVEWEIRAKLGDWDAAFRIAERLVELLPHEVDGWIIRAYAARRMKDGGLEKAWSLLHPALEKFPKVFLIPYNLACYAAQSGHADEAWQLLQRAIAVGGQSTVLQMAKADPDLKPLWKRLSEISPEISPE